MSSEQSPLDHQTVEQTKQQIRSLVGEIAQLSKSDVRAEGILRRVHAADRLGAGCSRRRGLAVG
jgi:TolA-binding protein